MPEIAFRNAVPEDVPALVALVNSAYRGESSRAGWTTEADLLDGQRTDVQTLGAELTDPDQSLLVAEEGAFEDDQTLVGCALMRRERPATLYLGMVTVDPQRQGTGLGKQLIDHAENLARETWGATRARMTVITARTALIEFYGRLGYHDTGAREPFPYGDERFGIPRVPDLEFAELAKDL